MINRWRAVLWLIIGILCCVLFGRALHYEQIQMHGVVIDDAYISLRHARNLADGHGLNFNRGERVEGYTSFLFTLLSAAAFPLGVAPEAWVKLLGILSAIGLLLVVYAMGRRLFGPLAGVCLAACIALDPRVAVQAVWGLESIPYAFLVGATFCALFAGHRKTTSVLLAAAALTRMEALQFVVPIAAYCLARRFKARALLEVFVPCLALFGLYYVSRWIYYGHAFPNTFYAKVGNPKNAYERGLEYVAGSLDTMGIKRLAQVALGFAAFGLSALLAGRIVTRKWPALATTDLQLATIVLAAVSHFAYVVAVGGDHFAERFVYHGLPLLLISLAGCCAVLAASLRSLAWLGPALRHGAPAAMAAWMAWRLYASPQRFPNGLGIMGWISLGQYLHDTAPPGAVVATSAAGAIPFYSELDAIDMLGLTDAHIAHLVVPDMGKGTAGHEKSDPAYVLSRKPTYITEWLDPDGKPGRGLRFFYDFFTHYELVGLLRMDTAGIYTDRVLQLAPGTTDADVIALSEGHGIPRGTYTWGVFRRTGRPGFERAFAPSDFQSSLGPKHRVGRAILTAPLGHAPGHVLYGPYAPLAAGRYAGEMAMSWANYDASRGRLCRFEVYDGERALAEQPLESNRAATGSESVFFTFVVAPEHDERRYEFRLWCSGAADVTVDRVRITKIEPASALD